VELLIFTTNRMNLILRGDEKPDMSLLKEAVCRTPRVWYFRLSIIHTMLLPRTSLILQAETSSSEDERWDQRLLQLRSRGRGRPVAHPAMGILLRTRRNCSPSEAEKPAMSVANQ
jgi:hypothetical protein